MRKALFAALLFLSPLARATSYTSIATGAWQSTNTWSPAGIPGAKDTVTLASGYTVTVSSIISSSASVSGITCDSPTGTGILVIYGKLDYKGTVNECSGNPWVGQPGGSLVADSTSTNLVWNIGYANCSSAPCALLELNGTSSNPFSVSASSLNSGGFGSGAYQGSGQIQATWTDFQNCGSSTTPCIDVYSYPSVGLDAVITYSSFTASGLVELGYGYANNTTFIFNNNTIVGPITSNGYGLEVQPDGGETGFTCQIEHNYIEGETVEVIAEGSDYGKDDGCIVNGNAFIGTATTPPYFGPVAGHATCNPAVNGYSGCHFDGNLFYDQPISDGSSMGGGSNTRSVFLEAANASGIGHLYGAGNSYNGDFTGFTAERQYNDIAGWYTTSVLFYMGEGSSVIHSTFTGGLILPAPNGYASMQMSSLPAETCDGISTFCPVVTATHNTAMGALGGFAIFGGEENNGYLNMYQTVENNIFWMTPATAGNACDTGWFPGNTPADGTFGTCNYNDTWGVNTSTYYASGYCGAAAWYGTTPGVNDLAQNPQFLGCSNGSSTTYANCNFTTWGQVQGISVSTWADIIAQFKCMNSPAQGCLLNNASILNYYYWTRRGFTPTNAVLHNAGNDGLDIGAIPYLSTTPPAFAGLLTSTVDVTGSPYFTTPSTPTPGGCYSDALLGGTICRPPAVTGTCPVNSIYNPTGDCSITNRQLQVDYAKTVPWSVDNNYYIEFSNGWLELFSRSSTGTYTFVRTIRTFSSSYGYNRDYGSGDSSFAGALWGDDSNWLWANNASTNTDTIYYTGSSSITAHAFQLKAYNVVTDSVTVVHDFTPTIATVNGWGTCSGTMTTITMQREGNQSDDDRYWGFGITDGGDSNWCAAFVYDKTLDSVVALSSFGSGGLCGAQSCNTLQPGNGYPNWVGMSPSGNYFIINWQGGTEDPYWTRGEGTEIYDRNLNWLGVATAYNGHGDVGFDANGLEVYVDGSSEIYSYGKYAFEVCYLGAVNANSGDTGCRRYLSIPCTWGVSTCPLTGSRGNTYFISMRGTHGAGLGQMMLSTQADGGSGYGLPGGNGGWGALENDAVFVDWSQGSMNGEAAIPPATPVTRISRNHGIFTYDTAGDDDYGSQANTAVDRTFTKAAWTTNLDQVPLVACTEGYVAPGASACNYYNMYTELGSGTTNYTLTVSTAGTGSGSISGTDCATGSYASGSTIGACTATPGGGSVFAGWSGTLGCTGTGTCTQSITANSTMIATFNLSGPAQIPFSGQCLGKATFTGRVTFK